MSDVDEIVEAKDLIRHLRDLDRSFQIFGSNHHRYQLGTTLSESAIAQFERENGIRLPEDYYRFLAAVGNGGAGPQYGVLPLANGGRDLSRPFPLTRETDPLAPEEDPRFDSYEDYPGILEICHQGCAIYAYLVVNGPAYGTIWHGTEDGFFPTGLTFSSWYLQWAKLSLRKLECEPLATRLRVGMSKAQVIATVPGDWVERPSPDPSVRFLESSEIPARLFLNERGIVIRVRISGFL